MLSVALSRAELERRAAEAHELLGPRCFVCPRGCKVDRRADVAGLAPSGVTPSSRMPDFKLWASETARRYLKRADYPDVARETIVEMHRQVGDLLLDERGMARHGLILRHLIMPGLLEETEAILRFVAEELGQGTYVNLMAQYYVSGKVGQNGQYQEIARGIHREEYEQALALARELGLRLDPRGFGERRRLARAT